MPLPLLPQQDFYITHRILPFDYAMPALEASTDHYGMGYVISGDRFTITPKHTYYHRKGELGMMPPYLYHRTMPLSPEAGIPYEGVTVLLAVLVLIPLLVHHMTAVGAEQHTGEQPHFIIAVRAFALLA